jgi:NTP pyrophosphatase (non-canonical NTP hydrolase)
MKKKYKLFKKLWHKLGKKHQTDILIEEMSELTKAILKARRYKKKYTKKMFEELADVKICASQLSWYFKKIGKYNKVKKVSRYKLKRLKKIVKKIK